MDAAHAVPQVDAVVAARTFDGTVAGCEDNRLALISGHHLGFGLRARLLFDEEEFAAIPVPPALPQQEHHLQREGDFAIKVLVQTIVASSFVMQHEWSESGLARSMAKLQKSGEVARISCLGFAERLGPGVRHLGKMRIGARAQTRDDRGYRIREVFVIT